MSAAHHELSGGLKKVIEDFSKGLGCDEITIGQADLLLFIEILQVLREKAIKLELELRCFRESEAGREAASFLENEATEHLGEMLRDGNVIRLNFGGRTDD